ncbi:MAG: hypothetical protein M0C28_05435 [Candidatus Moduliflexus flocculans]|nr:hypothetical protein [Candidatus Moduliflexus flocculans]
MKLFERWMSSCGANVNRTSRERSAFTEVRHRAQVQAELDLLALGEGLPGPQARRPARTATTITVTFFMRSPP